jgi:hypothetical protein
MPHNILKRKPRPPERDYSHRSLLDKLGVKPEQSICVLGLEDAAFLRDLAERTPGFTRRKSAGELDTVFFAAEDIKTLSRLKSLREAIRRSGAIWVIYPQGQKHIREVGVIAAGKAAGLTDNKVCRFSETHTALRFVIPLAMR